MDYDLLVKDRVFKKTRGPFCSVPGIPVVP